MSAKKKTSPAPSAPSSAPAAKKGAADPLIKTLAEVQAMSREEQVAFRKAGGTSIQNPS
jgi:hypothetical protein